MILVLETNEVDHIGLILMDRPWKEVNGLINKINAQANDPVIQSYTAPVPAQTSDGQTPQE